MCSCSILSEYGLRIRNFQAGSVYEVERGVRSVYDYKDAMLSNSLFLDFLKQNGLNIYKETSTRDIICLNFDYGASSYSEAVSKLKNKIKKLEDQDMIAKYEETISELENKKDLFDKKSREEIRTIFYSQGVVIRYGDEEIHYQMLYRTPGKAKKGSCMFIRDELYPAAREFLYMGLKLPEQNAPIVEIGAYSSLITSTIENRIHIPPEDVLILKDVDAFFETSVVSIETDENKQCHAIERDNYRLKNTLFDGQALIDESIFPEWADGYVLLRHHFTKCAAFCSRIQLFFKDYFGDKYETAEVVDMFGNRHLAKDIKLITTDNAIKWIKFHVSYEYWSEWVNKNGATWGIVKTAHKSKLGDVQRMSYQMVNALNIDAMDEVISPTAKYLAKLKDKYNDEEFIKFLKKNDNFANDYGVLAALCEYDPEFVRCDYFRDRKRGIIQTYMRNVRSGKIIQNADNLVIVGSPYAMLLHAVGEDPLSDPTFEYEPGTIQCWTGRFNDGEYIASFRSPFNSCNNLMYLHNHYHEYIGKYFNLGKLIIAVNMIGTDMQDRCNGSDQDSDSVYTTNHSEIVKHAAYCYKRYHTIVNNIPKEPNHYSSSLEDFARVDNILANSQRAIGESSNLAQICLSYTYTFEDKKFEDYACILAVIAQAAIDSSKRRFDIDITSEIKRIKKNMDLDNNGYPEFWLGIRRGFNREVINKDIKCPMNELYNMSNAGEKPATSSIPIEMFLMDYPPDKNMKIAKKIANMISMFSLNLFRSRFDDDDDNKDDYLLLRDDFDDIVNYIRQIKFSHKYISVVSWLLNNVLRFDESECELDYSTYIKLKKNKAIFTKAVYEANPNVFLQCFSKYINTPDSEKDRETRYKAGKKYKKFTVT